VHFNFKLLQTLLKYTKMDPQTGIKGGNWIRLARDRVQWRAFVSTVMNLCRLLFDKLSDYQLFKEYPAPWSN